MGGLLLVLAGMMHVPEAMAQVGAGPAPDLAALYGTRTTIIRQQYDYTGADVAITAPANAVGVYFKTWGAGGGHEIVYNGSKAGAGGYSGGVFDTTPGAAYTLMVGSGGNRGGRPDQFPVPTLVGVYGFGGLSMHDQGGGLSGVFSGTGAISATSQARALVVAGGGGGSDDDGGNLRSGGTNGNGAQSGVPSGTTDGLLNWTYTAPSTRSGTGAVAGTMQGSSDGWTLPLNGSNCVSLQWPVNWQSGGGGGYQGGGRTNYTGNFTGVNQNGRCGVDAESSGRGGSGHVAAGNRFASIESTAQIAETAPLPLPTAPLPVNVAPRAGTDTDQGGAALPIGQAGNYLPGSSSANGAAGHGRVVVYWIIAAPAVSVQKRTTNATGGPFLFTATNLTGSVANITTTAINTATPAAPTALPVTAPGTAVVLTETPAASFYQTGVTCTDNNSSRTGNTNPVATVSGTGAVTIPAAATAARAADIVCVFTNVGGSDLSITKTNTPGVNGNVDQASDTVTSGASNTYTIVVTNSGPAAVTGAAVRDPAATRTGQTCPTAANAVSCSSATPGACPAATTSMATLDSGYTLGNMPVGATVTLSFTCTVN